MAMNTDYNNINRSDREKVYHGQIEDDLPGYALGCLDSDASERVYTHLSMCESCRTLLRSYEETAGLLAFAIPQVDPPDSLKTRLMDRINKQSAVRATPQRKMPASFKSFFGWFSPAMALACLAIIMSLATVNFLQWRQFRTISYQFEAPLKIFRMRGTQLAPHADGTLVVGQNPLYGVLVASDLPSISSSNQFQLWLIRDGKKENGGTFSTTPLGYVVTQVLSSIPLSNYQSASITVEPTGGSQSPTGPELMVSVISKSTGE